MKRLKDSYNVDFHIRINYKIASKMDDMAEELGCSTQKLIRKIIKYGMKHEKEIEAEIMEEP